MSWPVSVKIVMQDGAHTWIQEYADDLEMMPQAERLDLLWTVLDQLMTQARRHLDDQIQDGSTRDLHG